MLLSSYLLFLGSKNLIGIIKQKLKPTPAFIIFSIIWAVFFLAFIWRFYKAVPLLEPVNGIPKFALPLGGLIFTYALPHLIVWTIGLLACRNLSHYASKTRGKVYKQLFKDLYRGLLLVYISIFISQIFIISTISYTGLNIGVVLIYALIILATVGFLFIARGSRRLSLVENSL